MLRLFLVSLVTVFISAKVSAQNKETLELCCTHFQKGKYFIFSIRNKSDSIVQVSIPSATQKKMYNLLHEFDFVIDTIKLSVYPRVEPKINVPAGVVYHLDGDLYCNRNIAVGDKLTFAIRTNSRGYKRINYIKVSLPDSSYLITEVKH